MKKFLSIFIAIAMVMSFAGMFGHASVAKATPDGTVNVALDFDVPDGYDALSPANLFEDPLGFYNGVPTHLLAGVLQQSPVAKPEYIYVMGYQNGEDFYWEDKLQDDNKYYRYSVISGTVTVDDAAILANAKYWTVELCPVSGDLNGGFVVGAPETSVNMVQIPTNYRFSITTGDVSRDGRYVLNFKFYDAADAQIGEDHSIQDVIIKYNLRVTTTSLNPCPESGNLTINGVIERGNGAGLIVPVDVYVAYPDNTLAGYAPVPVNSHTFSITFPHKSNITAANIGKYRIYVRDGRDAYNSADATEGGNDAIIYDYVEATAAESPCAFDTYKLESYLKTIGGSSMIYEGIRYNPVILVLKGHYATCDTRTTEATHLVTGMAGNIVVENGVVNAYNGLPAGLTEISEGVYKGYIEPAAGANVVKFKLVIDDKIKASVTIPVISKNAPPASYKYIRPYIDIDTYYSLIQPYGPYFDDTIARDVYDKLPMTVGNSFEMKVGYWGLPNVPDPQSPGDMLPDNYNIHNVKVTVSGAVAIDNVPGDPVNPLYALLLPQTETDINDVKVDEWHLYRVIKGGNGTLDDVKVSIDPTVWNRANLDCTWTNKDESDMAKNACCVPVDPKIFAFDVKACPVKSLYVASSLKSDSCDAAADAETSDTVKVGEKTNLVLNIANGGNQDDLECGCTYYVVHIYMTDAAGNKVPDSFTVDKKYDPTTTKDMTDLWFNEPNPTALGTGIPDLPIDFDDTDHDVDFKDCCTTITLRNVKFNYTNVSEDTQKRLIVQIFATKDLQTCEASADFCSGGCGEKLIYPLVYEGVNPIKILPDPTTSVSPADKVAYRAGDDASTQLLAGDNQTLYLTGVKDFTYAPLHWQVFFNGKLISGYRAMPLYSEHYVAKKDLWEEPYGIDAFADVVDIGNVTINGTSYENVYAVKFNHALPDEGTIEVIGYAYDVDNDSNEEQLLDETIDVLKPEFTVQIGLSDGSVIDNDGIITEGISELIYVTVTDPRTENPLDVQTYTFDTQNPEAALMDLDYTADFNNCDLPSAETCSKAPAGCSAPSPIIVRGLDNPNLDDAPTFGVYMIRDGVRVRVATFELVKPTISADPNEDIPFYNCVSCDKGTDVTLSIIDAHGHGAEHIAFNFSANLSYYVTYWKTNTGYTNKDGQVVFNFVPPYAGNFYASLDPDSLGAVYDANGNKIDELNCGYPCKWEDEYDTLLSKVISTKLSKDTEAPVITVTSPEDGAEVSEDTVTVSGDVYDNVGVDALYLGSKLVEFSKIDGSFTVDVSLNEGENVIKLLAVDTSANSVEKDITVTYKVAKKTVVKVWIGSDVMTVNGAAVQLDVPPTLHLNRTYVPLRAITEALGATVDWIPLTKGITVTLGDNTIGLQIDNVSAVVNGKVIRLPYPPYLEPYGDGSNSRTMIPLRVLSETLGADVGWDQALHQVTITLVQP